jgi:hypothetical protein
MQVATCFKVEPVELSTGVEMILTHWFCDVLTGERSDSGSVKSCGSGNMSETPSPTPSHGSAGDNTAIASSLSAGVGLDCSRYFVIKAGSLKAVEASLSRGAWVFTSNTERRIIRVFKVRHIIY